MRAMLLERIRDLCYEQDPLRMVEIPRPEPGPGEILIRVSACGVCHTELDEIEGRTAPPRLPVVLGHQIAGVVEKNGPGAEKFIPGQRVGVGWIFDSCGECEFCRADEENLCASFKATGRDANGGYAEFTAVPQDSAFILPNELSDSEAAPLLCAGAIGYRSLRLTGLQNGQPLGLMGFGASAHLVLKTARFLFPGTPIYVFTRRQTEQDFALELGADWSGFIERKPPELLAAVIDTTPAWKPVVQALQNLRPGGRLVINAIRKEKADQAQLLDLDYPSHLWMEKEIKSVANVSRRDIREFLEIAAAVPIIPETQLYDLSDANQALLDLKNGNIRGAKVLRMA